MRFEGGTKYFHWNLNRLERAIKHTSTQLLCYNSVGLSSRRDEMKEPDSSSGPRLNYCSASIFRCVECPRSSVDFPEVQIGISRFRFFGLRRSFGPRSLPAAPAAQAVAHNAGGRSSRAPAMESVRALRAGRLREIPTREHRYHLELPTVYNSLLRLLSGGLGERFGLFSLLLPFLESAVLPANQVPEFPNCGYSDSDESRPIPTALRYDCLNLRSSLC